MRTRALSLSVAALGLVVTGCSDPETRTDSRQESVPQATLTTARKAPAAARRAPARHALLISVDGLNPMAIKRLGRKRTPNLHRLLREGASTLNARTLYEVTETLPNHTGMLTGQPVKPSGTGVTFNSDNGRTLRGSAGHYVSSVFDVVHDNGGTTAMYVAKLKFGFLERSWNATNGQPDAVAPDNGTDKVDRYVYAEADEPTLVRRLRKELRTAPRTFTFLHLAGPDRAGHASGGMSAPYLAAVAETDALLGRVLKTIDDRPTLKKGLLVILTADHGTRALRHNDPSVRANYRIPFVAWGAGVAPHRSLYALNPHRLRPGGTRPTYDGPQPIRNGDAANVALRKLGLPTVPGSRFRSMKLR